MTRAGRVVGLLQKALDSSPGDVYSLEDVKDAIETGRAQVFARGESILITEILIGSLGKIMAIWLAAGDIEDIAELEQIACDAARKFGCKKAVFNGRRGWTKHWLPRQAGWRPQHVGFVKDLSGA